VQVPEELGPRLVGLQVTEGADKPDARLTVVLAELPL